MTSAKCMGRIGQLLPKFVVEPVLMHYADRIGIIDGDQKFTNREVMERSFRLAHGLLELGVKKGDHVAVLMPNIHEHIEAHYAIMGLGCPIISINSRLAAEEVAYIINHSESTGLIVDWEYTHLITPILDKIKDVKFIVITSGGEKSSELEGVDYEELLAKSSSDFIDLTTLDDEDQLASILYTSGTTSRPKGAMLSYRACWFRMLQHLEWVRPTINDVYLHVVPIFHSQAWGSIWTIPRAGGVNVCARYMNPEIILKLIREHKVTCWCGAPAVVNALRLHPDWEKTKWPEGSHVHFAGSPTPLPVLQALDEKGVRAYHNYGGTEWMFSTGTSQIAYLDEWDDLPLEKRVGKLARQGLSNFFGVSKVVRNDGTEVKHDGEEMGEIIIKGDFGMGGYWKNPEETARVVVDGWFHSGDLAVVHPDGYLEIRDRLKDMILSGGENIGSAEVERVVGIHPAVAEVAVIGVPHEKWGETPKAIVVLKEGETATEKEIIDFCRERLAHYKCPSSIEFVDNIPKTATGKVMKYILREPYWKGFDKRVKG